MGLADPPLQGLESAMKKGEETGQVRAERLDEEEWTTVLEGFDDATLYQSWSYGAVRWGVPHLSHLVVTRGRQVVGAAQVRILRFPWGRSGIAYVPWGPLWRRRGGENGPENLRIVLRALYREYAVRRGLLLRIVPAEAAGESEPTLLSVLAAEGFQKQDRPAPYRTILVDLRPPLEELRKNLLSRWRRELAVAERKHLRVRQGGTPELFEVFLPLYQQMLKRKKFTPGVDILEFRSLQRRLPDPLKMQVFIAESEGEPVAGVVVSCIGERGIYLLGATGDRGLKSRGSFLLHWRAMQWLKERGARSYDLGGIDPEANPGGYHFKKGLAGRDVSHLGRFEACENRWSQLLTRSGDQVSRVSGHVPVPFKRFLRKALSPLHRAESGCVR